MKKILIFVLFLLILLCASCQVDVKVAQIPTEFDISTPTDTTDIIDIFDEVTTTMSEATTTEENITTQVTTVQETTTEPITTTVEETTEKIEETEESTENTEQIAVSSKNVPVFMYHTSSEAEPGGLSELYVKPSEFEKQIQYLVENNYTFCTFDNWYNLHNIDKPVFLTFDDGYEANYTEIFPILQKYGAKITIFLMINNIAAEKFTVEMIREMSDSGLVKFESHTVSHPDLASISSNDARLASELEDSKKQVEEITGKSVVALAYPAGKFNAKVKEKASEYYLFGLRCDWDMHNTDYDDFEIRRFRLNRSTSLNAFINMLG